MYRGTTKDAACTQTTLLVLRMKRIQTPGHASSRFVRSTACAVVAGIILLVMAPQPSVAADDPDYAVLLIGNSHSARAGLPKVLKQLLEADGSVATVKTVAGWNFLAERLEDKRTQHTLESQPWTHVVLQAQKYSSSGEYSYSTDAAEEWIRRTRSIGAQPILFPEWAREGKKEEGARVFMLHKGIAAREPACVAPIGLAWEIMLDSNPDIRLHDDDGNHANPNGGLLTAYVLHASITGKSISELPETRIRGVSEETRALLRTAAGHAVTLAPPC